MATTTSATKKETRMRGLDCLIIHTPKFKNYYKPVGQFMWVNYMPLGLLGIADYLDRNGIKYSRPPSRR